MDNNSRSNDAPSVPRSRADLDREINESNSRYGETRRRIADDYNREISEINTLDDEIWMRALEGTEMYIETMSHELMHSRIAAQEAASGTRTQATDTHIDMSRHADPISSVDAECPICYEDRDPEDVFLKTRPCGHVFHKYCLEEWINTPRVNSNTCPNCRAVICSEQRGLRRGIPGDNRFFRMSDLMARIEAEADIALEELRRGGAPP